MHRRQIVEKVLISTPFKDYI